MKETDDDDEHFVDVADDDDDDDDDPNTTAAADIAADRTNDTEKLSTKSSWIHRNNLTCMLHTYILLVVIVINFHTFFVRGQSV